LLGKLFRLLEALLTELLLDLLLLELLSELLLDLLLLELLSELLLDLLLLELLSELLLDLLLLELLSELLLDLLLLKLLSELLLDLLLLALLRELRLAILLDIFELLLAMAGLELDVLETLDIELRELLERLELWLMALLELTLDLLDIAGWLLEDIELAIVLLILLLAALLVDMGKLFDSLLEAWPPRLLSDRLLRLLDEIGLAALLLLWLSGWLLRVRLELVLVLISNELALLETGLELLGLKGLSLPAEPASPAPPPQALRILISTTQVMIEKLLEEVVIARSNISIFYGGQCTKKQQFKTPKLSQNQEISVKKCWRRDAKQIPELFNSGVDKLWVSRFLPGLSGSTQ